MDREGGDLTGLPLPQGENHLKRRAQAAIDREPDADPGPEDLALTDLGNAHRFASDHKGEALWNDTFRRWHVWDGRRWRVDSTRGIDLLADATVRGIYGEARESANPDRRRKVAHWASKSESAARIRFASPSSRSWTISVPPQPQSRPTTNSCEMTIALTATPW